MSAEPVSMSTTSGEDFDIDLRAARDAMDDGEALLLNLDGFEGPLHVLLELARGQKVDLREISILQLARQYLDFIEHAQDLRVELAADYLVMASWLAWLKSRLLLPKKPGEEEPEAQDIAAHLAFRLQRLEAMRAAADSLFTRDILGETVFARGAPEGVRRRTTPVWEADLYDLLKSYGDRRSIAARSHVRFTPPNILTLDDARTRLEQAVRGHREWTPLARLLPPPAALGPTPPPRRSVRASGFSASLELVKEGKAHLKQAAHFAPLWVRECAPAGTSAGEEDHGRS